MHSKTQKSSSPMRLAVQYLFCSVLFVLITLLLLYAAQRGEKAVAVSPTDTAPEPILCIVLDAGHGGEDGGAVGVDGLLEKTVNLKIAQILQDMLTLADIPVIMTREEDKMLYDPTANVRGHKKMLDLRARLDMAQNTPGAILVSIHMNSFSQAKYSGLQVYYSPANTDSAVLAEMIQTAAKTHLQPSNERQIKAADSSIYILNRCERPAVLVECGFLSNPEECALLGNEQYLGKLSTVLFSAIYDYSVRGGAGA